MGLRDSRPGGRGRGLLCGLRVRDRRGSLTILLISGGLCAALLLLFLEVGLDEERELERERRSREAKDRRTLELRRRSRLPQRPRRPQ